MPNSVAEGPPRGTSRPATVLMRQILDISGDFRVHLAQQLGVNPTDLAAMEHLMLAGPLSPTDIARRLGITTAAATTVVDRLTAVGHANRTPHPTDRRGVVVVPNPESVRTAMLTIMPMVRGVDEALDAFDEVEQQVITRYLERVADTYRSQLPD